MSLPPTQTSNSQAKKEEDEGADDQELYKRFTSLVSALPSSLGLSNLPLYRHNQGWHASLVSMVGAMVADTRFAARPSDIIVATLPKSGTTWIKALLYATVHRKEHPVDDTSDHPFNSSGPHECVPFFEYLLYTRNKIPNLDKLPDPRLFSTHVPFMSLPESVVAVGCKVVYVCRNPKDALISAWHFVNKFRMKDGLEPYTVDRAAELYCDGISPFGPYWNHVLGYWHAHLAHPEQVLFFKYENMRSDPGGHVKKLAEFIGQPFSEREEENRVVDDIVNLCSFEHLSGLNTTQGGRTELVIGSVDNSLFFRRGVVGDWQNHLSPEMAQRIDAITEARFRGSGLSI